MLTSIRHFSIQSKRKERIGLILLSLGAFIMLVKTESRIQVT